MRDFTNGNLHTAIGEQLKPKPVSVQPVSSLLTLSSNEPRANVHIARGGLAGSLHLQQAEPIAGKGCRDFHHAGIGGCPDERHDAEIIHVLGNDVAAVHFAVGTELFESLEVAGSGGLGAVLYFEGDEAAFDGRDDVHFLVVAKGRKAVDQVGGFQQRDEVVGGCLLHLQGFAELRYIQQTAVVHAEIEERLL